jgi:hypothetical protein
MILSAVSKNSSDDRDKFAFISGNELHFEHADFEAREDHTYSVEVAARIEKGGDEAEVATKTITSD